MNKKLLTLAVAGAVAGVAGVAQADVTVYGKAAVSIDRLNVDKPTGSTLGGNTQVANNSSRLGIKFSEDLGGGLKAVGQYEASVAIDGEAAATNAGIFGGPIRNSYLGLSSDTFGTVLAGTHDTPFKLVGRAVELFPEYVGDARNITSPGGATWDLRPPNVVAYVSPNWAGVSFVAAWVADATTNAAVDNNQLSAWSANVSYAGGPLWVGAAYEVHDSNLLGGGQEDEKGYRIAASGTFGMFKVIALYQGLSDLGGVSGADRNSYGIGGSVTLAEKHVIKAQYYKADVTKDVAVDDGASMYVVGYDFKLSKKSTVYVAYAKTSNDAAGTFTVNAGGHGDTITGSSLTGADASATSIGMYTEF